MTFFRLNRQVLFIEMTYICGMFLHVATEDENVFYCKNNWASNSVSSLKTLHLQRLSSLEVKQTSINKSSNDFN